MEPTNEEERRVHAVRRRATRMLLAASVLFVPVPFYMVFSVGMIPLAWIAASFLESCFLGGLNPSVTVILAVFALHVVVEIGLLALISALLCRVLFHLLPVRYAILAVG